jgi:NAD(P)-dependent dehydrogenase (short-subunit alcohol dehydrogenase family)
MINLLDLTGKQILITGAAKGIGTETSILLNKLGAKLILIDIDKEGLAEVMLKLEGNEHQSLIFNLEDIENIGQKIREIVASNGPFDGFVHCVGIRCRRPLSMITPSVLNEVLKINFGTFVELIRAISKRNHFSSGLSIVGISSISSQSGASGVSAYAASKAAMDSAVRCLARELATLKIRLNTVVPAQINTPEYKNFLKMRGDEEDTTLTRQYLGLGEPSDVANVVAFLLSDSSRFITGSAVVVDGGYLSS